MNNPSAAAAPEPALVPPRRIAIVGGGFSGAVVAVQLLRLARRPLQVLLINESGRMARGLAYGTHHNAHVLNVPAGNMSALADDPDDFLRYCRWSQPQVQAHDFVPRRLYGAYLEALLSAAELAGDRQRRLERVVGRVTAIETMPALQAGATGLSLQLHDGRTLQVDEAVLAFGHFAPRHPLSDRQRSACAGRYVADPWAPGALAGIGAKDEVLLVGAGLTAMDVALALNEQARPGRVLGLSRRGLAPQAHRSSGAAPGVVNGAALAAAMGSTVRGAVRALRAAWRTHEAQGGDWRDLIGALRAHTPALWQRLAPAEQARFLRHVQPHWDVLRHRCAPQAHQRLRALQQAGRLQLLAGRLVEVLPADGGLAVHWRPRGSATLQQARVQAIVNCTGPTADVRRSGSALIAQLLAAGQLSADPLGLGLMVDGQYRLLDAKGQPVPQLSYIGPLLKAQAWEATAVPELRQHAWQLARLLTGSG